MRNLSFVVSILLASTHTNACSIFVKGYTLHIKSDIQNEDDELHCQSKDDDLGHHVLNPSHREIPNGHFARVLLEALAFFLSLEQQDDLERTVSIEEIKRAVWDCGTNKSTGPDGFTFEFLRRYWKFLENDILVVVMEFFSSETAARYIGCATFVALFFNLGVKVGGRMERINSWDDVVSKVTSQLSKWKLKMLSIGGRLTLIKSVLTSIPLYQMSSFKVPIKVLNILESIRRKFFNGIEGNERKLGLISWDTILASKINRALLSKWVWRFLSQTSSLWTRTIKAIHGEKGNLGAYGNITRHSPWLDIVREINVICFKARRLIDEYLLPKGDVQTRWVKVVPIKINVFAWRVCLDKLPTHLNLSLRGVEISSIMCPLCNSSVESASHIFFTCHVARLIWKKVLRWWDLDENMIDSYDDWLLLLKNIRLPKR
nr:RNA-directed DNA polymerase, eukaryota [Tanacetum cinerariifolium]